jgi:hypothetical protein
MIITADSRDLISGAKYSYLSANYTSGVSSIVVENSEEFKPYDWIIIGDFGASYTEIRQITRITRSTHTLTVEATRFSHSESTKVYIINYDQVRFFHTATATFSASDPLYENIYLGDETTQFDITNPIGTTFRYSYDGTGTDPHLSKYIKSGNTIVINAENFSSVNNGTFVVTGIATNYFEVVNALGSVESNKTLGTGNIYVSTNYVPIDTTSLTTKIRDTINATGFGWFVFYNSYTLSASQNSNAIPYQGFAENSIHTIIENFFSSLNNKEQKLISNTEAFSYLNEAYGILTAELGLSNKEYKASDSYDITITTGIAEYSLPDDFSDLLSVVDSDGEIIKRVDIKDVDTWQDDEETRYYLRGSYIGFVPSPTGSATYTIRYSAKSSKLTSMYDSINLPDNNYYCVLDYMIFRACNKLGRNDGTIFRELFFDAVKRMKLYSHSRDDSSLDSWEISQCSNI